MPDFLRLAEITGNTIKQALEPLRLQIKTLQDEAAALRAENASLKAAMPEPVDIDQLARAAAELIPEPTSGKDGKDGESGPAGKDGLDGKDGKDGKDGVDGKDGKDGERGPAGKDGLDGKDGKDGKDGADGKDGKDGKDADPVSEKAIADAVAAQFERRFADLTLSWERQARDAISKALDKMPTPKDGVDGLPADAIEITQSGRDVTITVGEKSHTIRLDTVIDQGVWKEGSYQKGDGVSFGGSFWIAQEDTADAPSASKAWRLAVKKGRDGRDLRESASQHDKTRGVQL